MTQRRTLVLGGTLAALYATVFFIIHSAMLTQKPRLLGAAVTFDLTATAALGAWAITRSRRAAMMVLALGFVLARLWLPPNAREGLWALRLIWAAAELAVITVAITQTRSIVARYRAARAKGPVEALEQALAPAIGVLPARLMATELSVLGYALGGWRRPTPPEDARTFSLYRQQGILAGVFVFLIAIESTILHVIVASHSQAAAWLLTASSLWGALWLIGDAQATRLQPLRISDESVSLSIGVRWRIEVPRQAIVRVTRDLPAGKHTLRTARACDLAIVTDRLLEARGLFGRKKRFDTLLLSVARADQLIGELIDKPPSA